MKKNILIKFEDFINSFSDFYKMILLDNHVDLYLAKAIVITNDNSVWCFYLYDDGVIKYHLLQEDKQNYIVSHI